jgi:hypothetical protein
MNKNSVKSRSQEQFYDDFSESIAATIENVKAKNSAVDVLLSSFYFQDKI